MFHRLEPYLEEFRPCFTRTAMFKWFVVIVVGLVISAHYLIKTGGWKRIATFVRDGGAITAQTY